MSSTHISLIRNAKWLYVEEHDFGMARRMLVIHGHLTHQAEISWSLPYEEIWFIALQLKRQLIADQVAINQVVKALT